MTKVQGIVHLLHQITEEGEDKVQKVKERLRRLRDMLKKPNLSPEQRQKIKQKIKDLAKKTARSTRQAAKRGFDQHKSTAYQAAKKQLLR